MRSPAPQIPKKIRLIPQLIDGNAKLLRYDETHSVGNFKVVRTTGQSILLVQTPDNEHGQLAYGSQIAGPAVRDLDAELILDIHDQFDQLQPHATPWITDRNLPVA